MSEDVSEDRQGFIEDQEARFKKEKFYFSFSSLVKLMLDPRKFYKDYVLKEREDLSAKFLDIGQLVHCLVLEPENFDDKFVIMGKKAPGGKLKTVIDEVYKTYAQDLIKAYPNRVFSLHDFEDNILSELLSQDLYQNLVDAKRATNGVVLTGDMKRLAKAITPETQSYFNILTESATKTIVDMDMANKANEKANAILDNATAIDLLTEKSQKEEVRMEMELKSEFIEQYPFGLKGILDCVKIDYENAVIHIVDLKTTSKTLDAWKKAFMTSDYNYWLQPIVYKELILSLIPKESKDKWTMKIHYVVVDSDNQVYCFPVSADSLREWEQMAIGAYDIGKWHLDSHNYELPYNYAKGLVEL